MATSKATSPKVATKASQVLKDKTASKGAKQAAASVLTQTKTKREDTSAKVATSASSVLHDKKATPSEKSVAGSALAQTRKKK